jgi:prepilin-type N-terminal cleavage/methylation domain-containing protein
MRDLSAGSRVSPRANSDDGFTLIEVTVAAILVVVFSLAFASSFSAALGASRGNLLRQQGTSVLNEELEYGRALDWSELAMSYVYTSAPMLNIAADSLDGAEAGFAGLEVLAVFPYEGAVTPLRTYVVDGQE